MHHVGLLVELQSNAMTTEVAHDAIVILVGVLLYGVTDVAHEAVRLSCLHTNLQTFLSHTHQLLLLGCCLADDEHARSVGIVAVEDSSEVDIHDVALLQNILFLRNAVAHHLVDTCADTLREALVVETSRHSAMCCTVVVAYLVDLESVHASMNMLSHLVEHTGVHHTAAAYAFYLFRSLDKVARRHLLTLILPIHYSFVKFCRLLSRQAVPNSFLLEYHNNYIKAPTTWEVFLF